MNTAPNLRKVILISEESRQITPAYFHQFTPDGLYAILETMDGKIYQQRIIVSEIKHDMVNMEFLTEKK